MLLNEFLKEHRKVRTLEAAVAALASAAGNEKELQTAVARQQEQIAQLSAALKEQSTHIQQMSAQLQVSQVESQRMANDR
jgi:hypothetical protein